MMHAVAAAVLLLMMVPCAEASCAWVLWAETSISSARDLKSAKRWNPDEAFETKMECEALLMTRWQRTRDQWLKAGGEKRVNPDLSTSEVQSGPGLVAIVRRGPDGKFLEETRFWYQCFPDAIDPRGPRSN